MSYELKPQHMAVADLAHRCAEETQHYLQQQSHDPRYCFELFRRAVEDRDQVAWEIICVQYEPLVAGWVTKHRGFEATGEEVQYFVNEAFAKIAGTITPAKFGNFPDLGSLLRYLKMCVHSMIVDYNRTAAPDILVTIDLISNKPSDALEPGDQVMKELYQQSFWEWINARLHDDKERAVVRGSFVLVLKPQEIYDYFPNLFTDIHEIYRVKQNVLARLRRDPEFREFLGEDD